MNDTATAATIRQTLPEAVSAPLPPALYAKLPVQDDGEYAILFDTARFEQAYRVARLFSTTKFVPEAYQGSPENCFVALQMATRLRIDPMMFMQKTYIVHNKPGMEAQLAIALINTRGPFTGPIEWRFEGQGDARKCSAYATHKQTGAVCEAECSIEMAKKEGWFGKSGSKWQTIPDVMLRYRSASFLGRFYCPEVLMGIAMVDELIDIGDLSDVTPGATQRSRAVVSALREIPHADAPNADALREFEQRSAPPPAEDPPAQGATQRTASAPLQQDGAFEPCLADVAASIKAGDMDAAADLARGLSSAEDRETAAGMIKSARSVRENPPAARGRRPAPSME